MRTPVKVGVCLGIAAGGIALLFGWFQPSLQTRSADPRRSHSEVVAMSDEAPSEREVSTAAEAAKVAYGYFQLGKTDRVAEFLNSIGNLEVQHDVVRKTFAEICRKNLPVPDSGMPPGDESGVKPHGDAEADGHAGEQDHSGMSENAKLQQQLTAAVTAARKLSDATSQGIAMSHLAETRLAINTPTLTPPPAELLDVAAKGLTTEHGIAALLDWLSPLWKSGIFGTIVAGIGSVSVAGFSKLRDNLLEVVAKKGASALSQYVPGLHGEKETRATVSGGAEGD